MVFETLLAQLLASAGAGPSPAPSPVVDPPAAVCPEGMRLVEGEHYENVQRLCTRYKNGHCFEFLPGFLAQEPRRTPIRACMDEYEWPNKKGGSPKVMVRFVEAEAACAAVGKRLCTEFEWEMACEGPETLPFPYGHSHDPEACNTDKEYRAHNEKALTSDVKRERDLEVWRLWQGERSGSRPKCVSSYGVHDLVGNVEEWVSTSRPEWKYRSSLKGGFWAKAWAGCRGTNDSHGPKFRFYEVGFRCCKDAG